MDFFKRPDVWAITKGLDGPLLQVPVMEPADDGKSAALAVSFYTEEAQARRAVLTLRNTLADRVKVARKLVDTPKARRKLKALERNARKASATRSYSGNLLMSIPNLWDIGDILLLDDYPLPLNEWGIEQANKILHAQGMETYPLDARNVATHAAMAYLGLGIPSMTPREVQDALMGAGLL